MICLSIFRGWMPLLAFLSVFLFAACESPSQSELSGKTMGTYYSIKYLVPSGTSPSAEAIKAGVEQKLAEVNRQMSTFIPDSEISRFNQSRAVDTPFPVSPSMIKVVKEAQRISVLSHGALDITVGPLVNVWGFGPEKKPEGYVPDEGALEERRQWTGMDKLGIVNDALVKQVPELSIDLSAIAKGFGVDVVSEYLTSLGIENHMVDIGGEVRAHGKNLSGTAWRIAIESPGDRGSEKSMQLILPIRDRAIATSGSYRNYFEKEGKRYSHTIDPATGYPVTHDLVSVSVLADTCMEADGWATAFSVLGPEKALSLANEQDIPIFLIVKEENGFKTLSSREFAPYLPETMRPQTD